MTQKAYRFKNAISCLTLLKPFYFKPWRFTLMVNIATLQLPEKWGKMTNTFRTEFGFQKGQGLGKVENIRKAKKYVHISCELPENHTV